MEVENRQWPTGGEIPDAEFEEKKPVKEDISIIEMNERKKKLLWASGTNVIRCWAHVA